MYALHLLALGDFPEVSLAVEDTVQYVAQLRTDKAKFEFRAIFQVAVTNVVFTSIRDT